jgi:hypothetical protein
MSRQHWGGKQKAPVFREGSRGCQHLRRGAGVASIRGREAGLANIGGEKQSHRHLGREAGVVRI